MKRLSGKELTRVLEPLKKIVPPGAALLGGRALIICYDLVVKSNADAPQHREHK